MQSRFLCQHTAALQLIFWSGWFESQQHTAILCRVTPANNQLQIQHTKCCAFCHYALSFLPFRLCPQGALFVVIGVTLAAVNAYSLAKGVGRSLAQKVIAAEMSGEEGGGAVAKQLSAVTQAIESGGFMRQVTAITLLRLTPVVPFRCVELRVLGLLSGGVGG